MIIGGVLIAHGYQLGTAIFVSFLLNSVDVLVGSSAVIIGVILLIHRLGWPLIERPLYTVQKLNIIKNKKDLYACGMTLIALPTETVGGAMLHLLEKLF